jgi:hypothetical protein
MRVEDIRSFQAWECRAGNGDWPLSDVDQHSEMNDPTGAGQRPKDGGVPSRSIPETPETSSLEQRFAE